MVAGKTDAEDSDSEKSGEKRNNRYSFLSACYNHVENFGEEFFLKNSLQAVGSIVVQYKERRSRPV